MAKFRIEFCGIAHVEADDYDSAVCKFYDNEDGITRADLFMTNEVDEFNDSDFEKVAVYNWDGIL